MKKFDLVTQDSEYELKIDEQTQIYQEIQKRLPIEGKGQNIGGEIYFNVPIDIPFNGKPDVVVFFSFLPLL